MNLARAPRRIRTVSALILATCAATISLAGCAGTSSIDGNDGDGHVPAVATYDFTQVNGIEPGPEVGVLISDALREAADVDAEMLLVDAITARVHQLEGGEYCAIDLTISYAGGGAEAIAAPGLTAEQASDDAGAVADAILAGYGASSTAELDPILINQVQQGYRNDASPGGAIPVPDDVVLAQYGFESWDKAALDWFLQTWRGDGSLEMAEFLDTGDTRFEPQTGGRGGTLGFASVEDAADQLIAEIEPAYQALADQSAAVPVWDRADDRLGIGSGTTRSASDLAEDAPEPGIYISDDVQSITSVQDCAQSPSDADSAKTFSFPLAAEDEFVAFGQERRLVESSPFASVDLAVMKNGKVSIVGGHVNGYIVDSNGEWIAG